MDLSPSLGTLESLIQSRTNEDNVCNSRTDRGEGVTCVAKKEILDKLSIYVPQNKQAEKPVGRLIKLGEKRDRSVNYLVVEAILEYLKRQE